MQNYANLFKINENATSPLFRNHNRSALEAGTYITHRVIYYPLVGSMPFCFIGPPCIIHDLTNNIPGMSFCCILNFNLPIDMIDFYIHGKWIVNMDC